MSEYDENGVCKKISFDGDGLKLDSPQDAEPICEMLRQNPDCEILILQGNTFNIDAAEYVGRELANLHNLKEAHFKDMFTSRGREILPVALKHLLEGISSSNSSLKLLDLSDNAIGPIGAPPVLEFLASPAAATLERLYVNNCGWGPDGSISLSTALCHLKDLKEFVCGRSRLEDKGGEAILKALKVSQKLETLSLPQDGMKPKTMKYVADLIIWNQATIRKIDLSDNTIKHEGAKDLMPALQEVSKLEILLLNDALLENEGFRVICQALQQSKSLKCLQEVSFEGNEISGDDSVDYIMSTFQQCDPNITLNLLENEFSRTQIATLGSLEGKVGSLYIDDESDEEDEESESESDDYSGQDEEEDDILMKMSKLRIT